MEAEVRMDAVYAPSDDVVAREIEGEIIIVPLVAGIGDMEDELFTLNETGKTIWAKLDGIKPLQQVAEELAQEFSTPIADIAEDVAGFVGELHRRKMLVEVARR